MNAYQKIICQSYGGGDYAHIIETPENWRGEAEAAGDTLFLFLMLELSDAEDCKERTVALGRLERAAQDIHDVISAMTEQG